MIDKSNSTMVTIAAIAAFVTVFSLVASKSLIGQMNYQNKVIDAKKTALTQLDNNLVARDQLVKSYNRFVQQDTNIIGGSASGSGGNNGNNAQIIADALPYTYNFPALTSSLEKVITANGLKISSVTGIDDQVAQQANQIADGGQPVPIPFSVTVIGSKDNIAALINSFQSSIRPFVAQKIAISSSGGESNSNDLTMTLSAITYYQPSKTLQIKKEVIK